jgi:hypothetical protein
MLSRLPVATRGMVVAAILMIAAACNRGADTSDAPKATAQAVSTEVQLLLDSGFTFVDRASDRSVSAVMTKDAPETPPQHRHILELVVLRGTVNGSENYRHDLAGYQLTVPELTAPNAGLPTSRDPGQSEATCEPRPAGQTTNNAFFLPDLAALHPGSKIDLDPAKLSTRLDMKGGALNIRTVQGCWELKASNGAKLKPQSLVYGVDSVGYDGRIAADAVTLTLKSLDGTAADKTIEVKPTGGKIELRVAFKTGGGDYAKVGDPMTDFTDAYSLLNVEPRARYTPYAKTAYDPARDRPGRECGSKRFTM